MSKVDAVARALWTEARCLGTYDTGIESGKERFRELARAAIAAMKGPTPAMIEAGRPVSGTRAIWGENFPHGFDAAIDAALSEAA